MLLLPPLTAQKHKAGAGKNRSKRLVLQKSKAPSEPSEGSAGWGLGAMLQGVLRIPGARGPAPDPPAAAVRRDRGLSSLACHILRYKEF